MLSYTSVYIPGYTGFIPKLEYVVGETYGNATRILLAHRAKLLQLRQIEAGVLGHKYLLNRTGRQPYEQHLTRLAEDRKSIYECPPPKTHRRLIYDGDPSSTSAIHAIERAKRDLKSPEKSSKTRQQIPDQPKEETVVISSLNLPDKNIFKKISSSTTPESEQVQRPDEKNASFCKKRDALQKTQSWLTYRTDWAPVPNYTGYIPGHKFSFGKTWGISTRESLERQKKFLRGALT